MKWVLYLIEWVTRRRRRKVPRSMWTDPKCICFQRVLLLKVNIVYFQHSEARQEKRFLCAQKCTMTSCYVTSCHVTLHHITSLFTFSWQCFQHCLIYYYYYSLTCCTNEMTYLLLWLVVAMAMRTNLLVMVTVSFIITDLSSFCFLKKIQKN